MFVERAEITAVQSKVLMPRVVGLKWRALYSSEIQNF
jgi:hypothetical protein